MRLQYPRKKTLTCSLLYLAHDKHPVNVHFDGFPHLSSTLVGSVDSYSMAPVQKQRCTKSENVGYFTYQYPDCTFLLLFSHEAWSKRQQVTNGPQTEHISVGMNYHERTRRIST